MKILKVIFRCIATIVLFLLILAIYITYVERNLLIVNKHNISLNQGNEIKIIQITDTQLGEYYDLDNLNKVVEKINSLKPDVVVFTGDLIDNAAKYKELFKISEVLSKIQCNTGKYAIYGNHDIGGGAVRYYEKIMSESGFTVLKNSSVKLKIKGRNVNIFGGDDGLLGYPNVNKTMDGISKDNINILLIHEPDLIEKYENYPIDLALSGHSHGGQVYIPFYGPIKKNELAKKYNKGMYNINNSRKTKLYVSSGLGNTKVPFRFCNIPAIELFEIN